MYKPNVVNLHFIDNCNYKCGYCFVKKKNKTLSFNEIIIIVKNIKNYFDENQLVGRINLVGGEVFLSPYLQQIIDLIYNLNIKISIVTNGSLLSEEFIVKNKDKIESIGISVDSLNRNTNLKIGRCHNQSTLTQKTLVKLCYLIKNNGIKLKINLCASKFNYEESIADFIEEVQPDRFKILQMTIIGGINDEYKKYELTDEEFKKFVKRYSHLNCIIETNNEIKESYLIVDSKGDFYCNKEKNKIGNLLIENFSEMVNISEINIDNFRKRYN